MTAPDRFLCIHSHFYQPPRENPWLEAVEYQDSARPFHDWNDRISAECYGPNGLSRLMDEKGWVSAFVNNYAHMSFNFGPTLLSWLEDFDPLTYEAILEGDRLGREKFSGHGPAIVQAYNHVILPLANRRDKETQVKWGLRDFEKRFGRTAESMWLPETAVDTQTLEILADHGMRYVILAPRQAKAVCDIGDETSCRSVKGERIDPRKPYLVRLPGGKEIAAFFYDGQLSKAVAFEGLLHNGRDFAERLMDGYEERDEPQLLHIATDGESYGHHHRHGDMALAYAMDFIARNKMARLTVYGEYLENNPPQQEARIFDDSSWSCAHGIERWKSDCGCNSGMKEGWNQQWRAPLREALDMLRDELAAPAEALAAEMGGDLWAMRDAYIDVIHDRSTESRQAYFEKIMAGAVDAAAEETILKLMEMERNLLLVYTSCAWFFDEISGIETVQNLQYACRVIELARALFDKDMEEPFMAMLEKAPSNVPGLENGRNVYEKYAKPARVDSYKIAAHLGALLTFTTEDISAGEIYCFDYEIENYQKNQFGNTRLLCADAVITSRITRESGRWIICALHLGDHNLNIGIRPHGGQGDEYEKIAAVFPEALASGNITDIVRLLDQHFPEKLYTLKELFKDQQQEILGIVMDQTLESVEGQLEAIQQMHYPIMHYLSELNIKLPPIFNHIAHYVMNIRIETMLRQHDSDLELLRTLIAEAGQWGVAFDETEIESAIVCTLTELIDEYEDNPESPEPLQRFHALLQLMEALPFEIETGEIQNLFYRWHSQPGNMPPPGTEEDKLVRDIAELLKIRLSEKT